MITRGMLLPKGKGKQSRMRIGGLTGCGGISTHNFHIADGTTGNFLTGEYTLADGRQGNMYHGPYPTNTIAAAAATQTGSTAVATVSTVTVTGASSVGTPVVNSAGPSTTVSQQEVISSQVGKERGCFESRSY